MLLFCSLEIVFFPRDWYTVAKSECLHDLDDNMNYFGHSEISLTAGEDVTAGNVYTVMQLLNYLLCF